MRPSAEIAVHEQSKGMNSKLEIYQLNVHKNDAVQLSMMNDASGSTRC